MSENESAIVLSGRMQQTFPFVEPDPNAVPRQVMGICGVKQLESVTAPGKNSDVRCINGALQVKGKEASGFKGLLSTLPSQGCLSCRVFNGADSITREVLLQR